MQNKKFAFRANCYLFTLYMYHDTIKKTKLLNGLNILAQKI